MSVCLSPSLIAIGQALLVTFLWSTSWVLIKIGLHEIPPLTFAGLRYMLAFLFLLGPYLAALRRGAAEPMPPTLRWRLVLLGLVGYTATQGAQFLGLHYLPAVTVTLFLNFSTVLVALLGRTLLREHPSWVQWGGVVVALLGAGVYLYPDGFHAGPPVGFAIVIGGVVANALGTILGRGIARTKRVTPLEMTVVSMGVGSATLLMLGLGVQGLPRIPLAGWAIIGWLAVVNTALAFTLWNRALQTLTAVQASIVNNTMLVQIGVLAWIFLGETITARMLIGMGLVMLGTLVVQVDRSLLEALRGRWAP